jgi:hypothetical protein
LGFLYINLKTHTSRTSNSQSFLIKRHQTWLSLKSYSQWQITATIQLVTSINAHNPFRITDINTETTTPYTAFKKAGFEVYFVTETGKTPQCDQKLIKGLTQKLLVRIYYPTSQPTY